jgi:hypothetical protein
MNFAPRSFRQLERLVRALGLFFRHSKHVETDYDKPALINEVRIDRKTVFIAYIVSKIIYPIRAKNFQYYFREYLKSPKEYQEKPNYLNYRIL